MIEPTLGAMVVTIDGPAGAGKSSVSRALAQRLGFHFLNTGAMYRAVALAARRHAVPWDDDAQIAQLAQSLQLELDDDTVWLDGQDVTSQLHGWEVTAVVRHIANNPDVRKELIRRQRLWAHGRNLVTEGRDQGTLVFPDAQCKIFLTASACERARRRQRQLAADGESVDFERLLDAINRRDAEDTSRSYGRLQRAKDAIELCTDGLSAEQVVDQLVQLVRQRMLQLGISNGESQGPAAS